MPKHRGSNDGEVCPIRLSEEFIEGLSRVWSVRVLDHIQNLVSLLPANPELGSPVIRESLIRRYGTSLRKLNVSTFVIVYRFQDGVADVLAIVYGPRID